MAVNTMCAAADRGSFLENVRVGVIGKPTVHKPSLC